MILDKISPLAGWPLSMAEDGRTKVSVAGDYEIYRVWSREGWLYVIGDSEIGFFTQSEAENWARDHLQDWKPET
jgi:hypothetical protein